MSSPPAPTGRPAKSMSSRLMTMKVSSIYSACFPFNPISLCAFPFFLLTNFKICKGCKPPSISFSLKLAFISSCNAPHHPLPPRPLSPPALHPLHLKSPILPRGHRHSPPHCIHPNAPKSLPPSLPTAHPPLPSLLPTPSRNCRPCEKRWLRKKQKGPRPWTGKLPMRATRRNGC